VLLGTTNTIETDAVLIGNLRSEGNLSFQTGGLGSTPSVSFRGVEGGETRVGTFRVGQNSAGGIAGPLQTADFSLGSLDGRVGTLTVSRGESTPGNTPSVSGTFTMGAGTLDATEIFVSDNGNGGGNSPNTGNFFQGAGEVSVGTLTLGRRFGTSANPRLLPTYHLGTAATAAVLRAGSILAGEGELAADSSRNIVWNNGTIRNLDADADWTITLDASWARENGIEGEPADGDFDNDALSNLQEFAFGTDPTHPTTGPIDYVNGGAVTTSGSPALLPDGETYFAVFGRRTDYVAAGLTYTAQFSADLSSPWLVSVAEPTVLATDGEIDAVSVPFHGLIDTDSGPQKARFFRLGVSLAP
jgi:hypothetical protein